MNIDTKLTQSKYFTKITALAAVFTVFWLSGVVVQAQVQKNSLRCARQSERQVECDSSHSRTIGREARLIRLTEQDSADFVKIVKGFNRVEVVGEGSKQVITYKFVSNNVGALFICITQNSRAKCNLYYNPNRKEQGLQILEDNLFVNMKFTSPQMVQTMLRVFQANGQATTYVTNEMVQVRLSADSPLKSFRKLSLQCKAQVCELRGVVAGYQDDTASTEASPRL